MKVKVEKHSQVIPTYIPKKANELPMFFENKPYQGASGKLYPIPYSDGISDEKTDVSYELYTLENEYVKVQLLPAVGGKLWRGYDKIGEHDFIYHNRVIKPALVGLAGAWISGGIEFNWPQHHRPTTFMPLEARVDPQEENVVWMGEVEPFGRMKGMVGISVEEGRSYIRAKVRIYNRTPYPQQFMWWANLAVPANENYRTVFPPDCEWVNDHDRRAVLSWPIAKGVYQTARPYDFRDGCDLSRYNAVKVPSSYLISQGQSDMDFVAGYDVGIQKGIATVANHHIAPGKKMWHWGIGDFGEMWCNNLTDEDGPYLELMTGVYTDNQPDFTWLAPYESREFEQYWYPVRTIGEVKNASVDAALNLEEREGGVYLGVLATGVFRDAQISLTSHGKTVYSRRVDLDPAAPFEETIPLKDWDPKELSASVLSSEGRVLVSYTPYRRGQKKPITPRKPVPRPREIETVEELYLHGYHLEQYKQHNYKAEDYYREGLKRDGGDARCNTSMARLLVRQTRFEEALTYCDRAIERLTMRNEHPTNVEAFYWKGLALSFLGRNREAYDIFYRAAWDYSYRSAALFELANLDASFGDYSLALEKLQESYGLNTGHRKAKNLQCALLRKMGSPLAESLAKENAEADPLDLWALVERNHFEDCSREISAFAEKAENLLELARDYAKAGLYEDALEVLNYNKNEYPLLTYTVGYYREKIGLDGSEAMKKASEMATGYCFPSAPEDVAVLRRALEVNPEDANACYYLGCLFYDRFRYEEAAALWEQGLKADPSHPKIPRNLSFYYFEREKKGELARERMEQALRNNPTDPRLLLEYQQLLKNLNCSPEERLAVYEKYPLLLAQRDDCYLDQITLVSLQGNYEKAIEMAASHRFHIYEGGEGKLTKLHAWIHCLEGDRLSSLGKWEEARCCYERGTVIPKSYGEAKTFFNQEAHLYYRLGLLWEERSEKEKARAAFEKGGEYKAAVSEISLFRALCLRKLGREEEAAAVLQEMLDAAENQILNSDLRSYYGVGSPSPMPFENDIVKQNLCNGNILKAFALWGKNEFAASRNAIASVAELDPYHFSVFLYQKLFEMEKE